MTLDIQIPGEEVFGPQNHAPNSYKLFLPLLHPWSFNSSPLEKWWVWKKTLSFWDLVTFQEQAGKSKSAPDDVFSIAMMIMMLFLHQIMTVLSQQKNVDCNLYIVSLLRPRNKNQPQKNLKCFGGRLLFFQFHTPRKIDIEPENDGLVHIIFLGG